MYAGAAADTFVIRLRPNSILEGSVAKSLHFDVKGKSKRYVIGGEHVTVVIFFRFLYQNCKSFPVIS